MGLITPFPLSPTPNKEALPLLINEHGWDGGAAFRELCAVPRLPEKSQPSPLRHEDCLWALPPKKPGPCYRMTKENGRTLSTVWGGGEQGAAAMEDLGIGSRQWLTLWNHVPPAHTALLSKWKTCLQDWNVKENIKRTLKKLVRPEAKRKEKAKEEMEKVKPQARNV